MLRIATAKIRILSDIFTIFASWTTKRIKVIRRTIKIFWRVIVAIASFLFAVALIIQLPQVQTFVADKVLNTLSDKIDGEISIEKIHLKPFTTLVLKNAMILDKEPFIDTVDSTSVQIDTFFRAEYIIARFSLEGLRKYEGIHIDRVFIRNAQMNLVIEDKEDTGDGDVVIDNLSRIFHIKKPETPRRSEKEIFHIRRVEISDMGFAMKGYRSDRPIYPEGGIDWNDMDVKGINLSARKLQFKGGIMSGELDRLSFREKSGYAIEQMSGEAKVGRGKTIIEDLHLDDLWSDVHLPLFMMSYENVKAFKDFISEVRIDGEIAESFLDFKTISYFAPQLLGNDLKADISGKMSGYVDNFSVSDINIKSRNGVFSGKVNGRLSGLPDIQNTHINAQLSNFRFSTYGLEDFISQWMTGSKGLDISHFAKGTIFNLNARASGRLNRMNLKAAVSSQIGKADVDVRLDNVINPHERIGISGSVQTENLNIGKVIDKDIIGPVTLKTDLSVKMGTKTESAEVAIDTLKIDRLYANGYDYSNITALGNISSKIFDGRIVCHDPNLNFLFQGTFALSSKTQNARYKFFANIGHADLNAINIDKRGISRVNLRASADFTKASTGDLRGKVDIADIVLQNQSGKYDIGNINLSSYSSNETYTIRMDSRFANGKYSGSAPVSTFVKDLRNVTLKKELPALFTDSTYVWNGNNYNLDFKFNNSMDLLAFAMPGLYIDEGTALNASIDRNGHVSASISSNRLAFEKNYLRGIDADFGNSDESLEGTLNWSELKIGSLALKNNHLSLHGDDNHLGLKFDYDNDSELENKGEIILHSIMSRKEDELEINVEFLPSSVFINAKEWNLQQSDLFLKRGSVDVRSFAVTSGDERISVAGKASTENADTLTLSLDRFDISVVNGLMNRDFGIKGAISGALQLTSPLQDKGILVDMICDSTYFADVPMGILNIGSTWDEEDQNFRIMVRNELDGINNIYAYGTLAPENRELNAIADFDRLNVSYAKPVLTDIFSEMEGRISGRLNIDGPLSSLRVSSQNTRLDDGVLKIAYTNVPYFAEGPFHIDETGVYFDNISIKDSYTGTGAVNGSINWDHFRDISFNTAINVNGIEAINLTEDDGMEFYGHAFGTGNVNITGPVNSLVLTVDAVTSQSGNFHIPVSNISTGKSTNLLSFTEEEKIIKVDPYEAMIRKIDEKEEAASDFTVKLRLNVMPEIEAYVELDDTGGNVLTGRGSGLIDLEVGSDLFTINGDYILNNGSYKFVAMGLVRRDFQIEDGSSIRFNGDIMNSDLDINAIYRTKASLSTLLADESSVSNKRNVDCGISISGKLSNPELSFSIEIPDLNPMIQSRVESAISTEDKVQKQFLSLVVSNNFLPDEQSGIVNNSSALYSNVSEILANQLSNIFQKLNIPLDLGLNYQPNESGNDIFDVAVSTQLFNNRVVVNGNIGNKQYTTSGSPNDVVGDLDIEIKLDRSGAFRLNLFSHSADQFSNYLDDSQRNGVGLMYQTEFNSFGQFIKNIFSKKAKRREAKMQEEQAMIQGKKVTIRIDAPEDKKEKDETDGK